LHKSADKPGESIFPSQNKKGGFKMYENEGKAMVTSGEPKGMVLRERLERAVGILECVNSTMKEIHGKLFMPTPANDPAKGESCGRNEMEYFIGRVEDLARQIEMGVNWINSKL
jgi:hypothetical protein